MKKKVLIIANFMRLPWENGNTRFPYIANLLDKEKCDVEIITSDFSHGKKAHRENNQQEMNKLSYKITLIHELGYKKNISFKRFYSHYIFAKNVKKYLKSIEKPDIIYCAIPSLDVAKMAAKFAKQNDIKFVIDIQDLWPEAFKMVFNIPVISNIIFAPFNNTVNFAYKNANDIIAVSDTYANRAASVNNSYKSKLSVFLGTDLEYFDECKNINKTSRDNNIFKVVYIGTLGHSYNLKCIIDALQIIKNNGKIKNIKFIAIGNGPLKEEFEQYAELKEIDYEFTGRLDYDKMVGKLCECDIAVNPIRNGAAQSVINKVGDYAAAGLPVISTQECEEYRDLVENYKIGFNCDNNNIEDIADKIEKLYYDETLRKQMGSNNRKLAEERFDRRKTYLQIKKIIEEE